MKKYTDFHRPEYCGQVMTTCDICSYATATHDCRGRNIEDHFTNIQQDLQNVVSMANMAVRFAVQGDYSRAGHVLEAIEQIAAKHTPGKVT